MILPALLLLLPIVETQNTQTQIPEGAVRIPGTIKDPKKIKDVPPVYPTNAERVGLTGFVLVEAAIGENGDVVSVKPLRGPKPLVDAAMAAIKQWRYTQTLLDGKPVPVIMTVTVNFHLAYRPLKLPDLVAGLSDADDSIRESAATWLGRQGEKARKAVPDLERVAKDDASESVKAAAAQALARIGGAQ